MSPNTRKGAPARKSHPTCHGCGNTIDLEIQNVLMEVVATPQPTHKQTIAWHQDCYENFLDQGELS